MRRATLSLVSTGLLLGVGACGDQGLTSPQRDEMGFTLVPAIPMVSANANCRYTPSGDISIPVGTVQIFTPVNFADCAGAFAEITYSPSQAGAAGFFPGTDCTVKTFTSSSFFKVRKCTTGPSLLRFYTNSSKTTLLQTVGIDLL